MANFYYNGVLLPEIPADVLAEYPYAFIGFVASTGKYQILASKQTMYFDGDKIRRQNSNSEPYLYCVEGDEAWSSGTSGSYGWTINSDRHLIWSNHNIPNGSETSTDIYFYGSDPVPEGGSEPELIYGIQSDLSSKIRNPQTTPFEFGVEYKLNETIKAVAIRIYAPTGSQTLKGTLWSGAGEKLAETDTTNCVGGQWEVLTFVEPIVLEAGKNYVVSAGFSSYYVATASDISFSDKVSYVQTRYLHAEHGNFPTITVTENLYGIVDIVCQREESDVPDEPEEPEEPEEPDEPKVYKSYGIESFDTTLKSSNNGNWSLGIRFQVAEERKVIGFRAFSVNLNKSITLKLWDSKLQLVTSVTGQKSAGDWTEFNLDNPITLTPNSEYRLSYYTNNSDYEIWKLDSVVTSEGFELLGGCEIAGDNYPSTDDTTFWGVDVIFDDTPPYDKKYLIQSGDSLFTVTDGVLTAVEGSVNAELFRTYGADDIPASDLLITLVDPVVLYWIDSTEDKIKPLIAVEQAVPLSQVVNSPDYNMRHPSITGIEKAIVEATDDVGFAVSFDSGDTWMVWTGSAWGTLSEGDTGMSAETMNSITSEDWNSVATTGTFKFRAVLPTVNSTITSLVIDYLN